MMIHTQIVGLGGIIRVAALVVPVHPFDHASSVSHVSFADGSLEIALLYRLDGTVPASTVPAVVY